MRVRTAIPVRMKRERDAITDACAPYACADFDDLARAVGTKDDVRLRPVFVGAFDDELIAIVERCGTHAHEHLAWTWSWVRQLTELQATHAGIRLDRPSSHGIQLTCSVRMRTSLMPIV